MGQRLSEPYSTWEKGLPPTLVPLAFLYHLRIEGVGWGNLYHWRNSCEVHSQRQRPTYRLRFNHRIIECFCSPTLHHHTNRLQHSGLQLKELKDTAFLWGWALMETQSQDRRQKPGQNRNLKPLTFTITTNITNSPTPGQINMNLYTKVLCTPVTIMSYIIFSFKQKNL